MLGITTCVKSIRRRLHEGLALGEVSAFGHPCEPEARGEPASWGTGAAPRSASETKEQALGAELFLGTRRRFLGEGGIIHRPELDL